jgi:V8-like Glu-specific endopeptidase
MRLRLGRSAVILTAASAALAVGVAFGPPIGRVLAEPAEYRQPSTVGALFSVSPSGQLQSHFCTASVVDSPAGNLILTAAHCMTGRTASEVAFVPDYWRGMQPFGAWAVSQIIEDQRWTSSRDPDDDFAFLVVRRAGDKDAVQDLTGGETIGIDVPAGRTVKVAGYPDGQDAPVSCANTALDFTSTQYEFACGGFTDGTSGSPLLADFSPLGRVDTVIGVIGGYEQGGYTPSVSYAARFSARLSALYQAALAAARQ